VSGPNAASRAWNNDYDRDFGFGVRKQDWEGTPEETKDCRAWAMRRGVWTATRGRLPKPLWDGWRLAGSPKRGDR